jgi:HAD superfamily hydrolase (TIGR01509 family)
MATIETAPVPAWKSGESDGTAPPHSCISADGAIIAVLGDGRMAPMAEYLRTERLVLRQFTADDAELLVELDSDPEVMRYLSGGVPTDREKIVGEILPRILSYYEKWQALGLWAAFERASGEFVGWFHLRPMPDDEPGSVELGYRLRRAAWGRGLATEGSRALLAKAFDELGMRRVNARTMTVNRGSRAVMERIGMRLVGTFDHQWPEAIPGSEFGDVEYEITADDWQRRPRLRAVLFDMDGTLLDSEKIWDVALDELAASLGGELSDAARKRMVGSSMARSVAILHADLGIEADPESSAAYLTEAAAELYRTGVVWKPGARELLTAVHEAGVPAALVTSTHRYLTEIALDSLGREFFAATVCGDEVRRPKPNPDPYLRAAELLGAGPAHCVAIEDSPLGIAAAEAAGCAVLAVPSEVPIDPSPARTVRPTLAGLTVADLAALVSS